MPAPRGPVFIICGIDADGEIQAVEIAATDELFTAIRENDNIANVRSFFTLDGGPDHEALLTASVGFFFDGEFFRYVKGTHPGGVPHSGPQGWISGAWQKQPIQIGYSGLGAKSVRDQNADAGLNLLNGDPVPAGEIWTIQTVSVVNEDNICSRIAVWASIAGVAQYVLDLEDPPAGFWNSWIGQFVMSEGNVLTAGFFDTILNDDIRFRYSYIRTDIDQ